MTQEGDASRKPLFLIITDMREKCETIGYLFLFFIKNAFQTGTTNNDSAIDAYIEFCKYMQKPIEKQLIEDLEVCIKLIFFMKKLNNEKFFYVFYIFFF